MSVTARGGLCLFCFGCLMLFVWFIFPSFLPSFFLFFFFCLFCFVLFCFVLFCFCLFCLLVSFVLFVFVCLFIYLFVCACEVLSWAASSSSPLWQQLSHQVLVIASSPSYWQSIESRGQRQRSASQILKPLCSLLLKSI